MLLRTAHAEIICLDELLDKVTSPAAKTKSPSLSERRAKGREYCKAAFSPVSLLRLGERLSINMPPPTLLGVWNTRCKKWLRESCQKWPSHLTTFLARNKIYRRIKNCRGLLRGTKFKSWAHFSTQKISVFVRFFFLCINIRSKEDWKSFCSLSQPDASLLLYGPL